MRLRPPSCAPGSSARTTLAVALSVAAALIGASAARAAPSTQAIRTPAQRQDLADLAYVLGEAHALRRKCAGARDDTWRARMAAMLEVERPAADERRRLTERFNAGFVAKDAAFPACSGDGGSAAEAEQAALSAGRAIAARLAVGSPR